MRVLVMWLVAVGLLVAADEVGRFEGGETGVDGVFRLERGEGRAAVLVAELTPRQAADESPWHFYHEDLPRGGLDGIGRPTLLELPEGGPLRATGPQLIDAAVKQLPSGLGFDVPTYAAGPITIRLPVELPVGEGPVAATALLTYMVCNDQTCRIMAERDPVGLTVPAVPTLTAAAIPAPKPGAPLPGTPLGRLVGPPGSGVTVDVSLHHVNGGRAVLYARFTPDASDGGDWHLYSADLSAKGLNGIGRPTRLALASGQAARAAGDLVVFAEAHEQRTAIGSFPIYPPGPVDLALPIHLPPGEGAVATTLHLTFMTCTDETCRRPVENAELVVSLPAAGVADEQGPGSGGQGGASGADQGSGSLEQGGGEADGSEPSSPTSSLPASMTATPLARGAWQHPQNVAELEALLARARAHGQDVFLDFTGPSCLNCQVMAKTVFLEPTVRSAFARIPLIEVDTDPPRTDLARWQLEHFGTSARPLYVRLSAGGEAKQWSEFFPPSDGDTLERFVAFIGGGAGSVLEVTILAAILGGLFTLLMPCTYPMIPFTVNFFAKQAEAGRNLPALGGAYAAGIVVFFVGLGVVLVAALGSDPSALAGDPLTNLLVAILFVILGLALFGVFQFTLPTWVNAVGGGRTGYLGALVMGLTFAITAFTCTAPIAGTVLAQAATTGSWASAIGMLTVYALVVAVPFFLLSLSPALLQRLPRAGGWMNEFKVVGGVVEIGAALKFLAITDYAWGWNLLDRSAMLTAWAGLSVFAAVYLLGWFRTPHDSPVARLGWARLVWALAFAALAAWFVYGLADHHLGGFWEGLFVADVAPER